MRAAPAAQRRTAPRNCQSTEFAPRGLAHELLQPPLQGILQARRRVCID